MRATRFHARAAHAAAAAIVLTLFLAANASAQVAAPVLGYLPDRGHILPVKGIPASASVARAIDFGGEFLVTAVSPRQDFALVSAAGSGAVLLAYPAGNTVAVTGADAFPARIEFSPSGSAAVLWYESSHELQILSGLPSAPVVRSVSTSFLSGSSADVPAGVPASVAVSDDGAWGVGAWPGGVWGFGPNGEVHSLLPGVRGLALAFFAGREDLAVATSGGISTITGVGGSASVTALYSAEGLAPSGLAISRDSSTLVMADKNRGLMTIDAGTGVANTVDCNCSPDSVTLMGDSLFRITGLTGSVFRVFDARSASVFQIPLAGGTVAAPSAVTPTGRLTIEGGAR